MYLTLLPTCLHNLANYLSTMGYVGRLYLVITYLTYPLITYTTSLLSYIKQIIRLSKYIDT